MFSLSDLLIVALSMGETLLLLTAAAGCLLLVLRVGVFLVRSATPGRARKSRLARSRR